MGGRMGQESKLGFPSVEALSCESFEGGCADNLTVESSHLMLALYETTLGRRVSITGFGVHSGKSATLTFHPATAGSGIRAFRSDIERQSPYPLDYKSVLATSLCTVVGPSPDAAISTVEHVLAALRACGVDNVLLEVDGPEMPIMDGSSAPFIDLLTKAGLVTLRSPRRYLKVLKPVRVRKGECVAELLPTARGFKFDITIDFPHIPLIGKQNIAFELSQDVFSREISAARTFGFMRDVDGLRAQGFALGSSFENTIVLGEQGVENPEGLRWVDEFVRHKALDAVGDLALAGLPIIGLYKAYRSGHALNVAMLEALFADWDAYTILDATKPQPSEVRVPSRVSYPQPVLQPDRS